MQITFEIQLDTQTITPEEFAAFETLIGKTFPEDYRQHMLTYNGGDVVESNNAHRSDPEAGGGLNIFFLLNMGDIHWKRHTSKEHHFFLVGTSQLGKLWGGG